jgi:DNA polymerase III delta prime subunit
MFQGEVNYNISNNIINGLNTLQHEQITLKNVDSHRMRRAIQLIPALVMAFVQVSAFAVGGVAANEITNKYDHDRRLAEQRHQLMLKTLEENLEKTRMEQYQLMLKQARSPIDIIPDPMIQRLVAKMNNPNTAVNNNKEVIEEEENVEKTRVEQYGILLQQAQNPSLDRLITQINNGDNSR